MVCSVPFTTICQSIGSDTSGYEGTKDASLCDRKVVEADSIPQIMKENYSIRKCGFDLTYKGYKPTDSYNSLGVFQPAAESCA